MVAFRERDGYNQSSGRSHQRSIQHHKQVGGSQRGASAVSLAKSSSGSSMGRGGRPASVHYEDNDSNQFITNYEAEMSALKPRERPRPESDVYTSDANCK